MEFVIGFRYDREEDPRLEGAISRIIDCGTHTYKEWYMEISSIERLMQILSDKGPLFTETENDKTYISWE